MLVLFLVASLILTSVIGKPRKLVQSGAFEHKDFHNLHEFSYIVQISTKMTRAVFCGGAVISHNTIISAAHCFFDGDGNRIPSSNLEIVLPGAKHRQDQGPRKVAIASVMVHPNFTHGSKNEGNDIAIMRTTSSLIDLGIQPIHLASNNERVNPSGQATLVVYRPGDSHPTKIPVQITPQTECNALFRKDRVHNNTCIIQQQICGTGQLETVRGDSGNPLNCKSKNNLIFLCGIFSRGFPKGKNILPDIYENVSSYLDFIHSKPADSHVIEPFTIAPLQLFENVPIFVLGFCVFAFSWYFCKSRSKRLTEPETEPKLLNTDSC